MSSDLPLLEASIIYFNDDVLVLNKHPGVPVIPERGKKRTLSLWECAERFIGQKLFVVHRIDRDTSGVVVFCRHAQIHRSLSLQFEQRAVKKQYFTVVKGLTASKGVIEAPLRQFGSGRMGVSTTGKPSHTSFETLEQFGEATLLKVTPETGRRHQIRVHLYHLGHPILGDRLYGQQRPVGGIERLMLHAASIAFSLPGQDELKFTAPVDEEWLAIIQRLRRGYEPENLHH